MPPSAVLSQQQRRLCGVYFSSVFHSSIANLCVGFSCFFFLFWGFTRVIDEELPADRSVSSSLLREKENTDILHCHPWRPFPPRAEKTTKQLLRSVLHTVLLFMKRLGVCVWCCSWLPGTVESLCSVQLNEPISGGQWSWLRGDVKAFMLRHQEEIDSYEIQMGSCPSWLCAISTLLTGRSFQHLNQISSD